MGKSKFYITFIIILILSNGLLIGYILKSNKFEKPIGKKVPRNFIIEQLHLDEDQIKKYDELITWHRSNIESKDAAIREIKDQLYINIGADTLKQDSLIHELNKLQYDIEKIHLKHFTELKAICKPNQLIYFQELENDLAKLFSRPRK